MLIKELLLATLFSVYVSARHLLPADLKAGTVGYIFDGQIVKTWTPDEFDEWRSTNPLVELLLVAGYPHIKPSTQGSGHSGTDSTGPTSLSQASSSVGNGGSFASAGVIPGASSQTVSSTRADPPSTITNLEVSTSTDASTSSETSTTFTTEDKGTPNEDVSNAGQTQTTYSENSSTKPTKPLTESSFLDVDETTSPSEKENEKPNNLDKENEIVEKEELHKDPASSTADPPASGDPSPNRESGRPSSSRPGFSSATSAASASSQVHAEGSALAESPGTSSKGTSESNSNSASVIYGEFSGSVSISQSSSSG